MSDLNPLSLACRQRGRVATAVAAVVGIVAAAAIAFALALHRQEPPVTATVLPRALTLPEFTLTDDSGSAFTRDRFRGRVSLVFFGFTHCPDICPVTLQKLSMLRGRLASGADEPPEIVFVSVDPERDSVERIAQYTAAFGEGVTGVRGPLDELDRLTSVLGAFHRRPATDDGYAVEHSAAVFVIDADAGFRAVFGAPHDVDAMVEDWPRLLATLGSAK